LLLAQAAAVIISGRGANGSRPITGNFLAVDQLQSKAVGHNVYAAATQRLFDLNITYVVAAFLVVGAVIYGLMALWLRRRYEANLADKRNMWRWLNFGIGGGLIFVTLGLVNGINDLASLLMLFTLVGLMAALAHMLERFRDSLLLPKRLQIVLALGVVVVPWLVFGLYLKDAIWYGQGLPNFVYWLDASVLLANLLLLVNFRRDRRAQGRWSDYLFAERAYIVLGAATATAVALQVFSGTLRK
jgi:hypothetical protein